MALSDVVDVQITIESARAASAGFGVALIIAHTKLKTVGGPRVALITSADDLINVYGFGAADPEYLAAQAMFAQVPAPNEVAIGFRDSVSAQQHTIELLANPTEGLVYSFTVDGDDFTDATKLITATAPSTPTREDVVDLWITALGTLFPGLTATKSGSGNSAKLVITGPWRSVLADPAKLKITQDHGTNGTIATDLAAFKIASDTWYGIVSLVPSKAEALAIAAWVEANGKFFVVASQDSHNVTADTDDLATAIKGAAYARTFAMYDRWNGAFADAAMIALGLSFDPGSATFKFKTLAGVGIEFPLSPTEATNAAGKNCNVYTTIGGRNIVSEGVVGAGEFADVIIFRDWLVARMGERVFGRLASAKKIPFTDGGIAILEGEVKAQLSEGVRVGGLAADPAPTTSAPKVADVNPTDKANRKLRTINFSATLAGAIHSLAIRGTISA